MRELNVTVYGTAQAAGSKRAVPFGGKKGARQWRVTDANRKAAPWKAQVAQVVGGEMAGKDLFDGPLAMTLRFVRPRPKGHFKKDGELSAAGRRRRYPTVKPDVLKLARGVEDALTGVAYRDDAQIVHERLLKEYGEPERVEIHVMELSA